MDPYLYYSFYITYSFLVTTGTITFIEALRTNIVPMRHILNLETCISIVAAYFYGKFILFIDDYKKKIRQLQQQFKQNKNEENLVIMNKKHQELQKKINMTRYVDWSITTPIMLLVLILAFRYNDNKSGIKFMDYLLILIFNYAMLGFGYLGEVQYIEKNMANFIGFLFFGALYGFMYYKYLTTKSGGFTKNMNNRLLFFAFLILWAFYGVFYQLGEETKNIGYNILDLLSKCFVGIYFWSYSSNIFV